MLVVFILGLFVGSFLNVVADRLIEHKNFLWGRSRCDFCGTPLLPKDLIPVLSFLRTRGKCRFCNHKLSWFYPFSEVFVGALFVIAYLLSGLYLGVSVFTVSRFLYLLLLFSIYAILFFTDVKYQLLPRVLIWIGVGLVLSYTVFVRLLTLGLLRSKGFGISDFAVLRALLISLAPQVILALLLGAFFLSLFLITKGKGMGFGDVRLAILIGLVHPFPYNLLAIFLAFLLGAGFSVVLLVLRRAHMKSQIAFGPFMLVASVLVLLWGSELLNLYSRGFLLG